MFCQWCLLQPMLLLLLVRPLPPLLLLLLLLLMLLLPLPRLLLLLLACCLLLARCLPAALQPQPSSREAGRHCTAQCLLANHAAALDVNRASSDREHSALSLACHHGHLPVCELLLQHGANPLLPLKDKNSFQYQSGEKAQELVRQQLFQAQEG